MPYREHTYIERAGARCFCDQLTSLHCACCGRPRCPLHLSRDLCNRCEQAAARVHPRLSTYAWISGATSGAGVALACLAAGIAAGPFAGLVAGAAVGAASYRLFLRRWKRRAGPALAATVGELPAEARDPDTLDASLGGPNNRPPPGAGSF